MARFDRIRYRYLYSYFTPKNDRLCKFDHHVPVQKHPHTCIAVRVVADSSEIHYGVARRESPGKLIALRNRMNKIRELGGIVPEAMTNAVNSYPQNFSKARARELAYLKLNNRPHVIPVSDLSALNAHTITQMVMEAIVADYGFDYSPEAATAAESAAVWLTQNVEDFRDTLPNILVDNSFLEALDRTAREIFADGSFGPIGDGMAAALLAKGMG